MPDFPTLRYRSVTRFFHRSERNDHRQHRAPETLTGQSQNSYESAPGPQGCTQGGPGVFVRASPKGSHIAAEPHRGHRDQAPSDAAAPGEAAHVQRNLAKGHDETAGARRPEPSGRHPQVSLTGQSLPLGPGGRDSRLPARAVFAKNAPPHAPCRRLWRARRRSPPSDSVTSAPAPAASLLWGSGGHGSPCQHQAPSLWPSRTGYMPAFGSPQPFSAPVVFP